jgi:hypothetical protein
MPSTAPISFDRWVALAASLLDLDLAARIDLLEKRGVDPDEWMESDEHHSLALAAEIAAGRMDRAEQYGLACAAEVTRRKNGAASEPVGDEPRAEAQTAQRAEAPAEGPAIAEATPSFLKAEPGAADRLPAEKRPSLASTVAALELPSFVRQTAGALPFSDKAAPVLPAQSAAAVLAPPSGQTIAADIDLVALAQTALPFPAKQEPARASLTETSRAAVVPKHASFPRLPMQTYASLCAELGVFPDRAGEILLKYGVRDAEARRALDEDWQARFAAHPDTRATFANQCAEYRAWLLQQQQPR